MYYQESIAHINNMNSIDRWEEAKRKIDKLINLTLDCVQLHENNNLILSTDILSQQIPKSHAAKAFNNFRNSMFNAEIVKLNAIWDRLDYESFSIPTIAYLIDSNEVLHLILKNQLRGAFNRSKHVVHLGEYSEEIETQMEKIYLFDELRQVKRLFHRDRKLLSICSSVRGSTLYRQLSEYRHVYIAHHLDDELRESEVGRPKYGDERNVLLRTCILARSLNRLIRDADFNFSLSLSYAKRNAESLWNTCSFDSEEMK